MADETGLTRTLGLAEATAIGLGTMIGGGIFILPSIAAAQAGPASALSFALGGAITLLSALSVAEIATDVPRAGGAYVYVDRALGPFAGTVVGLTMWIGLMFATAFYAVGFARYLAFFHEAIPFAAAAALLAVLLTALNYHGVSDVGKVQDVIVYTLVVLIVAFVGTGTWAGQVGQLRPFAPEGWGSVLATTGTIYVTFIGFQVIATAAGEVENPSRNLPVSLILSVVVPTILYVAVMLVSTAVLPIDTLAESPIPVTAVATEITGWVGGLAMTVGALLATVSSANASLLSAGRVSYAMGSSVLTEWLGTVHESYHTPHRAVVATGLGVIVLIGLQVGLATLAEVAGFVFLFAYLLIHVALITLRTEERYHPTFRLKHGLYPTVPVLGIATCLLIMLQMSFIVILGGTLLILGSVAWYAIRHEH